MIALAELEGLLKRQMGLDAASIGSSAIEGAVRARVSACRLPDIDAYREFVRGSEREMQELIEAIVVPETWFFRDAEAFAALTRMLESEWLPKHASGVLRLLSLPCSTGEEPYSIAMALLDARLPPDRFRVDAIDISQRAIEIAQDATYGRNSFRSKDLDFRERYFEATARGYVLARDLRRQVHFRQGNLFDAQFLERAGHYDAIFCRNILIYFDGDTQRHAIGVLERLLGSDAILFVAPAESALLLSHAFRPVKGAAACVLRKVPATDTLPRPAPTPVRLRPVSAPAVPVARSLPITMPATEKRVPLPSPLSLDDAIRLADQGRLEEAARCCRDYLERHGPSAAAFHSMGLISDASSNAFEAATYYRKALYLEPNHHEALVHLALTLEQLGDNANAQVFRNRARRLQEREQKS